MDYQGISKREDGFLLPANLEQMDDIVPQGLKRRANKVGFVADLRSLYEKAKKKVRAPNPIQANAADYVNWIIYDRLVVAAGSAIGSSYQFFSQPIGTNGKSKVDTNLNQVKQLDAPQWANVIGLGFYYGSAVLKVDIDALLDNYFMEFWVSNKDYAEGPIQCFPGAAGQNGTGSNIIANGMPQTSNFFDLRLPGGLNLGSDVNGNPVVSDGLIGVTILQGQTFYINLLAPVNPQTTSAGGTGLKLMAYLFAHLSRGVQ